MSAQHQRQPARHRARPGPHNRYDAWSGYPPRRHRVPPQPSPAL